MQDRVRFFIKLTFLMKTYWASQSAPLGYRMNGLAGMKMRLKITEEMIDSIMFFSRLPIGDS